MSDVHFDDGQDDTAFEAELDAARQEQDQPIEQEIVTGPEEAEDEPDDAPVSKDVEKLERIAADKSRAFKEERRKRQEAEERIRQFEARLAQIESGKSKPEEIDLSQLDETADPIGTIEALKRFAMQRAQQEQAEQRHTQAQTAQQRQFQQINTRMQEYEGDFRDLNPDYDDAAAHFRQARIAEYQEQGYEGAELEEALKNELVGMVARAIQSGKDPAEVVYKLAKNRGYAGAASKEVVDKQPNKLQTIERGQKAARSGSALSGKTGDGSLSAESVTRLEGAAFDQAFAKLREQARRAG